MKQAKTKKRTPFTLSYWYKDAHGEWVKFERRMVTNERTWRDRIALAAYAKLHGAR